ncbi:biopolymer transporter ExbD [Ruegeria sp. HKCCD8929]|uniref:ExbD/TolR family protein n=1 Tax=Ruegeria sp. HKCCD8929 TaxID=2683006 RepID=UPI001487F38B|nr:biopolymer transporter ExbD [Ruegeria sp. HKCCD8929]
MASDLSLTRRRPARAPISLVPMIDVMLILLVFFMVTSTYLNLDMIPAVSQSDRPAPAQTASAPSGGALLIRLGADGVPTVRGRGQTPEALRALLRDRLASDPSAQVIILPTGGAKMQALVSVMDLVTGAGVQQMRVVRLEARP